VSDLRIKRLSVSTVRLPVGVKRRHGSGDVQDAVTNVIVRLECEGGLTGFGEAAPWAAFTGTAEATAAALFTYLGPILIDADPFRIETLLAQADHALVGHPEAKAAMEAALLDVKGKALGVSAADLLGGRYREEIPLSFSLANPNFDADMGTARQLYGVGIRLFKVKTGFEDHRSDLRRLERLRAELPDDVDLRIDYNQGLEPWDAIRRLRELEAFRPTFIEQPVPADQIATMAAIAAALDTPIMADESVFTAADALRVAEARAADLFSIKVMKHGGALRAREVVGLAAAAGIACYGGDMFESGLGHAAGAQLIAATPNISLGCEFYQAAYYLTEDLLAEPFPISGGKVRVPTGPGLGVTVDEDRLAFHTLERRDR
jgi:muconate cycloisomerase